MIGPVAWRSQPSLIRCEGLSNIRMEPSRRMSLVIIPIRARGSFGSLGLRESKEPE